jgi:hypothetical protein
MSNTVKGRNVVVSMLVDEAYYPVFCAKAAEFVTEQDMFDVTSINSGADREFRGGMRTTTLTLSGITTLNNSYGRISITYLMQQMRTAKTFKITMTDDDAQTNIATFSGLIQTAGFSRETSGYSKSNLTVKVSGAVTWQTVVTAPTPEDEFALYITVVAAASSVSHANLGGATILQVQREGVGHTETSGTPSGRQFKYTDNTTSGTISFDTSIPFDTGEIIYVLYRS